MVFEVVINTYRVIIKTSIKLKNFKENTFMQLDGKYFDI